MSVAATERPSRGLRRRAAALLLAVGASTVGPGAAGGQEGATVGSLLGQYERLPEAHPGRVIIESAVGNYALGLIDDARRNTDRCPAYGRAVLSADGLFLAWRESVVGADEPAGLETEWRRAVRDWVGARCAG